MGQENNEIFISIHSDFIISQFILHLFLISPLRLQSQNYLYRDSFDIAVWEKNKWKMNCDIIKSL